MPMIWLCARKNSKLQTPDAAHQLHEHKNPNFVLEKPKNGGSEGQKRTKTSILCSNTRKTGVPKAKSAQKPRFCAREERGVGNSSAQTVGAAAVLPKWGRYGGAAEMEAPRRKRALLLGLDL